MLKRKYIVWVTLVIMLCVFSLQAKDLYVRPGSSGDGSLAKPFNEIQKAIDNAFIGDVIHVAKGVYTGKLKVGYLIIDKRGLTLVGGYKDGKFSERNPFKYPTIISEDPKSKNSSFDGAYIRVKKSGSIVDHRSTTVDGFWFDRKGQNAYDKKGNLSVPLSSNMEPVIVFEHMDCHILNCVFANTANYAVRLTGDGSSVENSLFVNVNYAGIDVFGKGDLMGEGYPHPRITIKQNTFVSVWNCCSLERGAGSFIMHSGRADITITGNIFHLSAGNEASMGYTFKDERNFNAEKWIHFMNNSVSQMRGGVATIYMTDLTASINIDAVSDLEETHLEAADNDNEAPIYKFDKAWFKRYVSVIPDDDPSNGMVDMDLYAKLKKNAGLPSKSGIKLHDKNHGTWYPFENILKGTFFNPGNDSLKGRGVLVDGDFPIMKGILISGAESPEDGTTDVSTADREYEKTDWETIWNEGDSMIGQAVELEAYYMGWDTLFVSGFGDKAIPYMEGADKSSHKILKLRKIAAMNKDDYPLMGYIKLGSAALDYVQKKAKKASTDKKKASSFSFVIKGVIKKAGARINFGKGPQIVIDIDAITAN
ncbi:MAG: DUF1565 domain-containing protein [Spirochaetales bacterium]|nr:DUF1565 domain-containing protein [Spirochaetales bacterium]